MGQLCLSPPATAKDVDANDERGYDMGDKWMTETMVIGNGVKMLKKQYLAGYREEKVSAFPVVPRKDVKAPHKHEGNIDDLFKNFPDLEKSLYNDVKVCTKCGKPCAFTLITCNSCGATLPDYLSKSENVFSAFLFGVKSATKGFPLTISLRHETEDVLIFDDMLQLTPCHLNGISKKYYIPDWRYLLQSPKKGLEVMDGLERELMTATKVFLADPVFRKTLYRDGITDEYILSHIIASFNFPPSQFQMHVQWLVQPMTPFQHLMQLQKNHFHHGRGFPLTYVRKLLQLDKPYDVKKETPIEEIMAYYKELGVDYDKEWAMWYYDICVAGTDATQNWIAEDFKYVVEDGKVKTFTVENGTIMPGEEVAGEDPNKIQTRDKAIFQQYGRPYDDAGKPTGTYLPNPLTPEWGGGGYHPWPPGKEY
jgi:hypothetical protein